MSENIIIAIIGAVVTITTAYLNRSRRLRGASPQNSYPISRTILTFLLGAILTVAVIISYNKISEIQNHAVKAGTIVAYFGLNAPEGWLMCNGAPVPQEKKYDELRKMCKGGKVPDLRGMFLRGINNGRSDKKEDPEGERHPGEFQKDSLNRHHHVINFNRQNMGINSDNGGGKITSGDRNTPDAINNMNTDEHGGAETRPKNVAVNFIIKY
ncbi:MAG: tail fiber protein [bacterium]|nr:tail fiber protein [bacterium]